MLTGCTNFKINSWQNIADHFPGTQPIANLEDKEKIEFRAYQALAVSSVIFSGFRGVVRAATGSGKTLIAAGICGAFLPKRSLVMIHGKELLRQSHEEFTKFLGKENVGVIDTSQFSPKAVTLASIDTFSFYLGSLPVKQNGTPAMNPITFQNQKEQFTKYLENDVDMLVFDECVPPGTRISTPGGYQVIEKLKVGDVVWGYDHTTEQVVPTVITHVFDRYISSQDFIKVEDTLLTPNHPVWTEQGYLSAEEVLSAESLCGLREDVYRSRRSKNYKPVLFSKVLWARKTKAKTCSTLSWMWRGVSCLPRVAQVLFSEVFRQVHRSAGACIQGIQRTYATAQQAARCAGEVIQTLAWAYEPISGGKEIFPGEDEKVVGNTGLGKAQWWQWTRSPSPAANIGACFRVADRSGCSDKDTAAELPNTLQARHCFFGQEDCYRSGRKLPSASNNTAARCSEGRLFTRAGVDSSPVQEQRNFKRFRSRTCTSKRVLNLETVTGNYIANGLLVHNCHHGSADTWQDVGQKTNAYHRVGLSGTPLKHDELSDMLMMSLVGPVVYDLNASWLQKKNYLAKARLEIRRLDYTSPKTRGLNYNQARQELLIKNQARHVHIANDILQAIQEKNTRLLVLTGNSVEIAEEIAAELEALARPLTRKLGFTPFTMVTGQMNSKKVAKAFNDLRKGNIRCVITTKIADEGIDVPDVNLLFLVGGGKAYVSTVQRIGRGLRKKDEERELLVVDYFTLGNKYMEKHDKQRLKTYENEDFFYQIDIIDV